eukprot:TRINITY_DN14621_c0_g1_i3.p1 TRINITY_DN14621_c0_g1~~TRINITY_DN14621_c0_g1_i3.p1  ORF type:complete len:517 (+),score=124.48 TRINITY_DN14621_c0_g1_i3:73-1623(+)
MCIRDSTWDDTDDLLPSICTSCLPEYLFLESNCYSVCPENYVNSSDGLSCIVYSAVKRFTVDDYVRLYPHLLAVGGLAVLAVLIQGVNKRTITISNLVVILSYVSISSWIFIMVTTPSGFRIEIRVMFGVLPIVQIVLNVLFLKEYKESIATDFGFMSWANYRWIISKVVLVLSTVFTLQTFRLLYSRLMNTEVLLPRFKNINKLFDPLTQFSKYQVVLVQGLSIIFTTVELMRLPVGTANYTFTEEFLILSVILLFLLIYEIKYMSFTLTSLECEGNSVILNDPYAVDQSINSVSRSDDKSVSPEPAAEDYSSRMKSRVQLSLQEIKEEEKAMRRRSRREEPETFVDKDKGERQPGRLTHISSLLALSSNKFSTLKGASMNMEPTSKCNDSQPISATEMQLRRERIKNYGKLPMEKFDLAQRDVGGEKKDKPEAEQENEEDKQMCRSSSVPDLSKISANDSVRAAIVPKFKIPEPKREVLEENVPKSKFKEKPVAPRKLAWVDKDVPERIFYCQV